MICCAVGMVPGRPRLQLVDSLTGWQNSRSQRRAYQLTNRPANSCSVPCRELCRRGHAELTRIDNDELDHRQEKKGRSSIVEPMNPDESGFVVGVDGPEREGGDDQGRLCWRTVWTALLRRPGGCPGSGAAADAAGPGSSIDGADSRHATTTVRFRLRLRLQSRFQP